MNKLKRLHYFYYLVVGKNLKQVRKENKIFDRHINPLGRLSKNALPF